MPAIRPRPARPFGLLDAMILVAAAAGWLAATRYFAARSNFRTIWFVRDGGLRFMARYQFALLGLILALALIAVRLRSPRPRRRRLWRQPGFAACFAVGVAFLVEAAEQVFSRHAALASFDGIQYALFWRQWTYQGPVVAGAWLMLALTGRWRAEPGVVDRLGRLVGAFWIAEYFACEVTFGRCVTILIRLYWK